MKPLTIVDELLIIALTIFVLTGVHPVIGILTFLFWLPSLIVIIIKTIRGSNENTRKT